MTPLLQPDVVCRIGATVTINGRVAAKARRADVDGRPLGGMDLRRIAKE